MRTDERGTGRTDKAFYVSPFNPVDGSYTMSLPEPDDDLRLSVTLHRTGGRPFVASVRGTGRPATTAEVVRAVLTSPVESLRTVVLIRWQGVRLWLRGLPVQPRPAADETPHDRPDLPHAGRRRTVPPHPPEELAMTDTRAHETATGSAARPSRSTPPGGPTSPRCRRPACAPRSPTACSRTSCAGSTCASSCRAGAPRGPAARRHPSSSCTGRTTSPAGSGASGLIGFGESYMAGDWDAPDLAGVLTVFARQMSSLVPPRLQAFRRLAVKALPSAHQGSQANTRRNISAHYDLSNEMFELFLDPTMTYSSALFEPATDPDDDAEALAVAQVRKIERLLDAAGVTAGTTVLEIGTGWGELALRAAARGASVRSVTLSVEQAALARRRRGRAGPATWSRSRCATTATRPGATTPWCRWR